MECMWVVVVTINTVAMTVLVMSLREATRKKNTKNISAEAPEVHTTRNFTCTDWVADRAYWVWDHEVPSECTSEKHCCET